MGRALRILRFVAMAVATVGLGRQIIRDFKGRDT